jgi:hypothetical protein
MLWWWLLPHEPAAAAEPTAADPAEPLPGDEAGGEPATDPQGGPFPEVLRIAKQHWFEGRSGVAREWFAILHSRVLAGEAVAPAEVAEALTWLGEIQYLDDDPDAARLTFEALLRRDPETPISPYHHPTEVVNLFELVRAEVKSSLVPPEPAPPPARPPAPAWVLAPFGAPQLAQGRLGAGLASGGIQVALAATSVATRLHVARLNAKDQPGIPVGSPDERAIQTWRYGAQWPSTFLFYGAWFAGSWEATRHFRRHWTPPAAVSVSPVPGGLSVGASGRF